MRKRCVLRSWCSSDAMMRRIGAGGGADGEPTAAGSFRSGAGAGADAAAFESDAGDGSTDFHGFGAGRGGVSSAAAGVATVAADCADPRRRFHHLRLHKNVRTDRLLN